VEEMNEVMIENWNKTIKANDTIYFVGDFVFGPKDYGQQIFNRLSGRKHLIRGNHDTNQVCKYGWETINHIKEIKFENKKIIFCHFPIESWNGKYHGFIHIHGHTHASPINKIPNRFNACVEVKNYTSFLLKEIIQQSLSKSELN
jgi:calcineurin-like phosphoesterase family protein